MRIIVHFERRRKRRPEGGMKTDSHRSQFGVGRASFISLINQRARYKKTISSKQGLQSHCQTYQSLHSRV